MSKDKGEFVKVSLNIRRRSISAAKNRCLELYGSLHGYLGQFISDAIDHYLTCDKTARTQEKEHIDKIIKNRSKRQILLLIAIAKNYCYETTQTELERIIGDICGIDKRTKKKYLKFLIENEFLEVKQVLQNKNVIYEVNYRRIYNTLRRDFGEEKLREKEFYPLQKFSQLKSQFAKLQNTQGRDMKQGTV